VKESQCLALAERPSREELDAFYFDPVSLPRARIEAVEAFVKSNGGGDHTRREYLRSYRKLHGTHLGTSKL
jgi:hypothetical protein